MKLVIGDPVWSIDPLEEENTEAGLIKVYPPSVEGIDRATDTLVLHKVREASGENIIMETYEFVIDPLQGQVVSKRANRHIYLINEDKKLFVSRASIVCMAWMDSIKSSIDFEPNPNNSPAWPYFQDSKVPIPGSTYFQTTSGIEYEDTGAEVWEIVQKEPSL